MREVTMQDGTKKAMKTVLVGCPTVGLDPDPTRWLQTYIQTLDEFKAAGFLVAAFVPYKVAINKVDDLMMLQAVVGQYDYFFRMDDDIWGVPPGSIKKLIDADKDFISGVMPVNDFPYSLCAFIKKDKSRSLLQTFKDKTFDFNEISYNKEPITPVDLTAMPYTLFKVSALLKLAAPFFQDDTNSGAPNDSVFCQKCLDVGVQPYVHMEVQMNHRNVTPWNRWYLWNADARKFLANGKIKKGEPLYERLVELFGVDGTKDIGTLIGTEPDQIFKVINNETGKITEGIKKNANDISNTEGSDQTSTPAS